MSTLILMTTAPTSSISWHALGLAQSLEKQGLPFSVFFYQDAVHIANALNWMPDDQRNLTQEWQKLKVRLPVCVSAALNRGITDQENAIRHQLSQSNLAERFELVGLGELADAIQSSERVIQF
jgi:tRNA 2-thiouridine synthesizing protein D